MPDHRDEQRTERERVEQDRPPAPTDATLSERAGADRDHRARRAGYQTLEQEWGEDRSESRAGTARRAEMHEADARLIPPDDARRFEERWMDIQGRFVDDPQGAAREADRLTADVVERLTATLQTERNRLVAEVGKRDDVSTEDLRLAVQRYRAFFQRLLTM
jgi:hypothetical protein